NLEYGYIPRVVPLPVADDPFKNIKRRSFVDKLRVAKKDVKQTYNELKTEALSYGLKSRISFSGDTFRLHKKTYLKITISGKSLKVFYALDVNDYRDSPIPLIDYSSQPSKAETPSALKIKSDLAVKRAKILIEDVCKKDGLTKSELNLKDWINEFVDELPPVEKEESPAVQENVDVNLPADNSFHFDFNRRSFVEKMASANDEIIANYNEIKQELMAYGLKNRISTSGETFRLHKKSYVKITISGKSLKLYFGLNYEDFKDSPIPLIDYSDKPSKKDTPCGLFIKSNLAVKRSKYLIDMMCEKDGLTKKEIEAKDWAKELNLSENEEVVDEDENLSPTGDRFNFEGKRRSFNEKLAAASEELVANYNELKQELLAYGLNSRISASGEAFRLHCKTYVKLTISGKSIKAYFAVDFADYKDSSIPLIDCSNKASKKEIPCALKIKSGLAVKRAKLIIKDMCEKDNIHK
ncbi:MAG: hypothetical protein MJ216_02690, partial [Bacilli bacterium]|nr:hypothetical protein [Bacilli bacterium]